MEHEIPFGNSNRENGPTFLDFPLFLGIFQWDEPTKRVPFTAEPEIPEILAKWKPPIVTTPSTNQRFCPDSGQILRHQYGISVAEWHTFLRAKRPHRPRARRNGCFRRLHYTSLPCKFFSGIGVL